MFGFKSHRDEIVDRSSGKHGAHRFDDADRYCKAHRASSDICDELSRKSYASKERFVEAAAAKREMENGNSDYWGIPSRD